MFPDAELILKIVTPYKNKKRGNNFVLVPHPEALAAHLVRDEQHHSPRIMYISNPFRANLYIPEGITVLLCNDKGFETARFQDVKYKAQSNACYYMPAPATSAPGLRCCRNAANLNTFFNKTNFFAKNFSKKIIARNTCRHAGISGNLFVGSSAFTSPSTTASPQPHRCLHNCRAT